ncbi:hypothetical protein I4U23_015308 [Adineta vaga]|nr:hypothetical protein I4U23_015308 [Adineta vaga]
MATDHYTHKLQTIIQINSHIRDMVRKNVNEFLNLRQALLTNSGIQDLTAFREVLFPLIQGPRIEQLNVRITSDKVQLALCGENSSGKTAFLHRFLDVGKILPSGDGPVTARITKLTYAPSDQACIRIRKSLRDATLAENEIKLTEFFTGEKPNWMGVARSLAKYVKRPENIDEKSEEFAEWARYFVEVHIPSPTLALGIDIYDTPGFLLDDAPVLKDILHDLVELIHPTIIFMYANPTTDDATRGCFLAMKTALSDLDTTSLFFLNSKADINQMLKFKQGMTIDDFISILAEERARRYDLLLRAPFLANDHLEGLPKSVDRCEYFDLFSVNSHLMKPYGPLLNETSIGRIVQFVANNDLTIATRICKLILPIIDAFFSLLHITSYQTSERLIQLQYDALNWEKIFFEAYKIYTEDFLKNLFTNIFERFNQERETVVDVFVKIFAPFDSLQRTIQTAVNLQILKPAIHDSMRKFMGYIFEHITSNSNLTRGAAFNEILINALGVQEMSDFATMLLGDHSDQRPIGTIVLYMVNTISIPIIKCAQTLQNLDYSQRNEFEQQTLIDARDREEHIKSLVRQYLLHMEFVIEKERHKMQQAIKLWSDHQRGVIQSLIEIHYKDASPLLSSHQITLKCLKQYVPQLIVIECKLCAAQDMAKFRDQLPKIRQEITTSTMFSTFIGDWGEEKNLVIKKLTQPTVDQAYAVYYEAHYHLRIVNLHHPTLVNIHYLYEHYINDETSELWMIFPPISRSLNTFLEQSTTSISLRKILQWMIDLADALIVMHGNELVHRNVILNNILLTEDDHARLIDLGNWNGECDMSMRHNPAGTVDGMNDDMRGFGEIGQILHKRAARSEEVTAIIGEFYDLIVKCLHASRERPITADFAHKKLKFIMDMF